MISFQSLLKPGSGKLGNSMFQIASTIGLSKKFNCDVVFPEWSYEKFLLNKLPHGEFNPVKEIREREFHYQPEFLQGQDVVNRKINLWGWFQSEKYWEEYRKEIREQFKFDRDFQNSIIEKIHRNGWTKETIGISIRRGDYVDNPCYAQLPITYYILALLENFPNWRDYNILVFSDDSAYCKIHFQCLKNVFYTNHLSDIEQLCMLSLCENFVISNSTFAWWGAYLGETDTSKIIHPAYHFRGRYAQKHDAKDYYPKRSTWIEYDHRVGEDNKKLDLSDVTFVIPLHYDHSDRAENLFLTLCMLQRTFNTNFIIGEQGSNYFADKVPNCTYVNFDSMEKFHRTKMLNDMVKMCKTPIFVNYDADVLLPPMQLFEAVEKIRNNEADVVYPYDGRFARVNRKDWFKKIEHHLDVGIFGKEKFKGTRPNDKKSVGGAIVFNKEKFCEGGMENERMISYAPEDLERFERFYRLGFRVERIKGKLFHIDHWTGVNSSSKNPYFRFNHKYLDEMQLMSNAELKKHVSDFEWSKNNFVI